MDEFFRVDDLLNFPNNNNNEDHHHHHVFSSSSISNTGSDHHHSLFNPSDHMDIDHKSHHLHLNNNNKVHRYNNNNTHSFSSVNAASSFTTHHHPNYDFTDQLCVPNDDVAELEWLSNFVDDSFTDFHQNDLTGTLISQSNNNNTSSNTSIPSAARSKRSRQRTWKASTTLLSSSTTTSPTLPEFDRSRSVRTPIIKQEQQQIISEFDDSSSSTGAVRRCSHCASEKTPQWRTGPMGPKTLCNACGVRYKSGRLVPEYRPAASPTFVLTQHSNSHRKVMELRRQKEVMVKQQQGHHHHHHQGQGYRHSRDFEVC